MLAQCPLLLIGCLVLGATSLTLGAHTAAPGNTAAPDDRLIVPGMRVGRWTLTMTLDDLLHLHGYPVRLYVMAGLPPAAEAVFDQMVFRWDGVTVMAGTFVGRRHVEFLQTGFLMPGGNRYRTDRGIGFLARRAVVMSAYGRPTAEVVPQPMETRMIYDDLGVAFSLDAAGRIHTMFVFRPGTAGRFWHLI